MRHYPPYCSAAVADSQPIGCAAIDWYLFTAKPTAVNLQQRCVATRWDWRTDRRTPDGSIDPALHTMQAVQIIKGTVILQVVPNSTNATPAQTTAADLLTGHMPFLALSQQHHSTKEKITTVTTDKNIDWTISWSNWSKVSLSTHASAHVN